MFCPDSSELGESEYWYDFEDEENSIAYQFETIGEYFRRNEIIKANLLKDPFPIYEKAIGKWKSDDEHSNYDIVATNPLKLDVVSFAPIKGQSLAEAYEAVLKSIRNKYSRHREYLRKIYKQDLEEAIFEGIPKSDPIRESFFKGVGRKSI